MLRCGAELLADRQPQDEANGLDSHQHLNRKVLVKKNKQNWGICTFLRIPGQLLSGPVFVSVREPAPGGCTETICSDSGLAGRGNPNHHLRVGICPGSQETDRWHSPGRRQQRDQGAQQKGRVEVQGWYSRLKKYKRGSRRERHKRE